MAVLVVDDDAGSRATYKTWLQARGFEVLTARDGRSAIEVMDRVPVGLVLLDLYMPDMDGFEVLREIKARAPSTKVIVMSGSPHARKCNFLNAALAFGAHSVLGKPFALEQLLALMNTDQLAGI